YLNHVRGGGVVCRLPFLAVAGSVVCADPRTLDAPQAVVDRTIDGTIGGLHAIPSTPVVKAVIRCVVVGVLRADVSGDRISDAVQVKVVIFADNLPASAHVLAR